MAYFDTVWYLNTGNELTTGWYGVPKRPQNTAVTAGQLVREFTLPAATNERVFVCIVAGTTANTTDAAWSFNRGTKTVDGTATWQECTGMAAVNGDAVNTINWTQLKAAGVPSLGVIIKRNNGASYQICTTAGTLGAAEPAFSDTAGVTTTETSATTVWTCIGLVTAFTGGQAPMARIQQLQMTNFFSSGNTIYVGSNHAETQSAHNVTLTSPLMCKILCHNYLGPYPPTPADYTTGATITTTGGGSGLQFAGVGSFYIYGISFRHASSWYVHIGSATAGQNWYYLDNCEIVLPGSPGSVMLNNTGSTTIHSVIIFNNTTVKFGNAGSTVYPYFCDFIWQNGPVLSSGSVVPTTLIEVWTGGRINKVLLKNLDLSLITGNLFSQSADPSIGTYIVQDCKLSSAVSVVSSVNADLYVQYIRSDSTATSYKTTRYAYEGTETTETSIVRTGGAKDPTGQVQSRKIVTTAAQWLRPFKTESYVQWNSVVSNNVTVTVCGIVNSGALPLNDEIWMDVEYLGDASSPLGKIVTTTKANVLASGTSVASDSSSWSFPTYVSFDGFSAPGTVLSNNNLTVTHGTAGSGAYVLSTAFVGTGKYYFEAVSQGSMNASNSIGVIDSTRTFSAGVNPATGVIWLNISTSSGVDTGGPTLGSTMCAAIDLTNRLVWYRVNGGSWNGNASYDPAAGTGGVAFLAGVATTAEMTPYVAFAGSAATDAFTGNFGATTYSYSVPSGFSNWPNASTPFKLTTTLSSPQPGLAGYIHVRPRVAKNTTLYIDPKITLS